MQPLNIFTAYSHKDEPLRDELEKHLALLKRSHLAVVFHDRRILPGQDWSVVLDEKLFDSHIILLLISPDFLASDYCYGVEMQTAIELHAEDRAVVIPVVLRPCEWQEDAALAMLQALPRDGIPVTRWPDEDEAFLNIAQGIRRVVDHMGPMAPALDAIMTWSPSALVAARFNRILSGALPRPPSSIILVMPDHAIQGESLVAGIILTGPDGEGAEGVPMTLSLKGGRFGAAIGVPEPPVGQPVNAESELSGGVMVKIHPDEKEVLLIVNARGYPPQIGRFVAGPPPDVYPWGPRRKALNSAT